MSRHLLIAFSLLMLTSCGCKYVDPVSAYKVLLITVVDSDGENIFEQQYRINNIQLLCASGEEVPFYEIDSISNTVKFPLDACGRLKFNEKTSVEYTLVLDSTTSQNMRFDYLASNKERCGGSKFEEINGFFMDSTYSISISNSEKITLVLK